MPTSLQLVCFFSLLLSSLFTPVHGYVFGALDGIALVIILIIGFISTCIILGFVGRKVYGSKS